MKRRSPHPVPAPAIGAALLIVGVVVGCNCERNDVVAVIVPPADTTVVQGESIVLSAAAGAACVGGPAHFTSLAYWRSADSAIVSVAGLDSIHARITGRGVGTTVVTTSKSPVFADTWTTTRVTVR